MSQFNGLLRKYIDMVNEASPTTVPPTAAAMAAPAPAAAANPWAGSVGLAAPKPPAGQEWYDDNGTNKLRPIQSGTTPPAPAPAPAPAGPANPWAGKDPAKEAAWAKLSPEDQKWLGGADPTDKIILARAPSNGGFLGSLGFGKKPPAAAAAPAAAAPAAAAPAAAAPAAQSPEQLAAAQKANGVDPATGQNVSMTDPATGQKINPENGLPVTPQTAAAPATQQAAKPRIPAKSDPAVLKIQQDLIAKGAKIKADGVMGPATQAAMKQFGQGGKPAAPNYSNGNPMVTPSGMDFSAGNFEESVTYGEDQTLARIIQLARG